MAGSSEQGAAAATPMQQVAPYLVELSGKVLFGDIWQRPSLSQIGELITHLAFYYGWPVANGACQIAAEVFAERDTGNR
jgi:hypothetical protein